MIQVTEFFIREAADALYERLGRALCIDPSEGTVADWDRVEADAQALGELAQAYTKPGPAWVGGEEVEVPYA